MNPDVAIQAMGINQFKVLLNNKPNALDKAVAILGEQMYDLSIDVIKKVFKNQVNEEDEEASYRVYTFVEKLILEKYLENINKQLIIYQDPKNFGDNV